MDEANRPFDRTNTTNASVLVKHPATHAPIAWESITPGPKLIAIGVRSNLRVSLLLVNEANLENLTND